MRMVYSAPILACQVELESKSKKDGSAVNSKPVDKMYQNLQGSKKERLRPEEHDMIRHTNMLNSPTHLAMSPQNHVAEKEAKM